MGLQFHFGQMHLGNRLRPGQVRDRPAELQHPVIGPRRQLQLAHDGCHNAY